MNVHPLSTPAPLTFLSHDKRRLLTFFLLLLIVIPPVTALAQTLYVPVRWCGIQGAPAMVDPGVVNEHTTDDVLWRRHERPTDAIYMPMVDMSFRAGATHAIKDGVQSFPIIRDPMGTGGNIDSTGEAADAATLCRRVWQMGDPLYYDSNNNGVANSGVDTLLSVSMPETGMLEMGHDGAPLVAAPIHVRYVDANGNGAFNVGEHLYRDENLDGEVDGGDTLLCPGTDGPVIGDIEPGDLGETLRNVPSRVKYVDLILEPPDTYNIGYPQVQGVTAVSANDFNPPGFSFPVHGIAALGIGGNAALCDDPSQYLPPGPDYTLFETQMIAHEFGHGFGLNHGNEVDHIGTPCLDDNVMQYCWQELGSAGMPDLHWVGVGDPSSGRFNDTQIDIIRDYVQRNILGGSGPPTLTPLIAGRTDAIGDVPEGFAFIDVTDYSVTVNPSREMVEFALATRRPFPNAVGPLRFIFVVDMDGNRLTGGAPQAILQVPTDFGGAEAIISIDMPSPTVLEASFYRYDVSQKQFRKIPAKVGAKRISPQAVVDFPGGGFVATTIREEVRAVLSLAALGQAFANRFRVEFAAVYPQANVIDRARSQGMNFDAPIFPQCELKPDRVAPGESLLLTATGLVPDHHVHVFLGDQQLAQGMTDTNGTAKIKLVLPDQTRTGRRLVTAGTGAVTADCSLLVEDAIRITRFTYQRQNGQATLQWTSRLNGPFAIEASTDLINFETIATGVQSPHTFTLPPMPKRFLRVRSP